MTNPDLPVEPDDIATNALRLLHVEPGPDPVDQLSKAFDTWHPLWAAYEQAYGHLDPERPKLWPNQRTCIRYATAARAVAICVGAFAEIQQIASSYLQMRDLTNPVREAGE